MRDKRIFSGLPQGRGQGQGGGVVGRFPYQWCMDLTTLQPGLPKRQTVCVQERERESVCYNTVLYTFEQLFSVVCLCKYWECVVHCKQRTPWTVSSQTSGQAGSLWYNRKLLVALVKEIFISISHYAEWCMTQSSKTRRSTGYEPKLLLCKIACCVSNEMCQVEQTMNGNFNIFTNRKGGGQDGTRFWRLWKKLVKRNIAGRPGLM